MNKNKKIHSVDFKVKAKGNGCVNFNGSQTFWNSESAQKVNNVKTPKLLNFSAKILSEEKDKIQKYLSPEDVIADKQINMYISTNCLRHALFKTEFPNHVSELKMSNCFDLLKNPGGLIRGYAVTDTIPLSRKSSILLEKAVDYKRNLVYETLTTTGARDRTSLFAEINAGETEYVFYGSINIEEIQFISTDNIFGRANILASKEELTELTKDITEMLEVLSRQLELNSVPKVEYGFWVRKNRAIKEGEWGILFNQDAIDVLVKWVLNKLENLVVKQAKGHMETESIVIDYNNGKHFRIKKDELSICETKDVEYEIYYEKLDSTHSQSTLEIKDKKIKTKFISSTEIKEKT